MIWIIITAFALSAAVISLSGISSSVPEEEHLLAPAHNENKSATTGDNDVRRVLDQYLF